MTSLPDLESLESLDEPPRLRRRSCRQVVAVGAARSWHTQRKTRRSGAATSTPRDTARSRARDQSVARVRGCPLVDGGTHVSTTDGRFTTATVLGAPAAAILACFELVRTREHQ